MVGRAHGLVEIVVLVGRADAVATVRQRRDIAVARDDALQRAPRIGRQVGHLAAHAAERQARVGRQALGIVRHSRGSAPAPRRSSRRPRRARARALPSRSMRSTRRPDAPARAAGAREARDREARHARPTRPRESASRRARPRGRRSRSPPSRSTYARNSGRVALRFDDRGVARRFVVIPGELQRAARLPLQVMAFELQPAVVLQRVQERAARDLRVERVAQIRDGTHEADCRGAALLARIDERDVPAARSEALRHRRCPRSRRRARRRGDRSPASRPRARAIRRTSISRLKPKPSRFSARKPASTSAVRTPPATVHVASVAPGAASRASSRTTSGDQTPGFLRGREAIEEERVDASLRAAEAARRASPSSSVRITWPASKWMRWKPASGGGQLQHERAGEGCDLREGVERALQVLARERAASRPRRNAGGEGAAGSARIASQAARKFRPSPKPVSRMVNVIAPAPALGQAIAAEEHGARLREPAIDRSGRCR